MLRKFTQAMLTSSAIFFFVGPLQSMLALVLQEWLPELVLVVGMYLALFCLNTSTIDFIIFFVFMKGFRDDVKNFFGISDATVAPEVTN